jgi:hypothetical protein
VTDGTNIAGSMMPRERPITEDERELIDAIYQLKRLHIAYTDATLAFQEARMAVSRAKEDVEAQDLLIKELIARL